MPNFRLIRAAVKPAKRHEHTDKQTDRQTDSIFIYIDIWGRDRFTFVYNISKSLTRGQKCS